MDSFIPDKSIPEDGSEWRDILAQHGAPKGLKLFLVLINDIHEMSRAVQDFLQMTACFITPLNHLMTKVCFKKT